MTAELEQQTQDGNKPKMRWYTLHVYSSMEKSVQKAIIERIERSELKDQFGEVLLPIEKVEENRNGRRFETERRMYPGYVFVEMVMSEETWHLMNSTPRVIEFLGNNHPVPLSTREINEIKERMSAGTEKARPKIMFEAGEVVRIKEGPFTDFNGRVEEVMYDKSRMRCFVSIFGRETSVELAFNEVEKI
ncbi:MAG: transcription termination/antitermination protein NusG [Sutterellaceae bacterium]|nr:transcription termination/antitermination protein NusG [Sutterellaceae bacterium]